MNQFSFSKIVTGNFDEVCSRVSEGLKPIGFGVLTRIDFDQKIKEKLGETVNRCVILGACNPKLALEAYKQSTDVALFIPCNVVVREVSSGTVSVEAMRPLAMLSFIEGVKKSDSITKADRDIETLISSL